MLVCIFKVNPDIVEYNVRFNIALNRHFDITDIQAKFLFEENLWAEIAVILATQRFYTV